MGLLVRFGVSMSLSPACDKAFEVSERVAISRFVPGFPQSAPVLHTTRALGPHSVRYTLNEQQKKKCTIKAAGFLVLAITLRSPRIVR